MNQITIWKVGCKYYYCSNGYKNERSTIFYFTEVEKLSLKPKDAVKIRTNLVSSSLSQSGKLKIQIHFLAKIQNLKWSRLVGFVALEEQQIET